MDKPNKKATLQKIISSNDKASQEQQSQKHQRQRSRYKQKEKPIKSGRPRKTKAKHMTQDKSCIFDNPFQPKEISIQSQLHQNPIIENIRNAAIDFFSSLELPKGLVFDDQQRKIFNKKIKKMKHLTFTQWTQTHEWNLQAQTVKLLNVGQLYDIDFDLKKYKALRDVVIESCSICAQECTQQFYKCLLSIYRIISQLRPCSPALQQAKTMNCSQEVQVESKQELKQLAKQIHGNVGGDFYFMSMNFHRDLLIESKSKKRLGALNLQIYEQFVFKVKEYMRELVIQQNQ